MYGHRYYSSLNFILSSCRLTYPSIFIVYQMVTILIFDFSVLVGRFDQATLFCSSIDLEESFRNPTAFCSFTGSQTSAQFCITILISLQKNT